MTIRDYNLAMKYARSIVKRTYPELTPAQAVQLARRRCTPGLIALAAINNKRAAVQSGEAPNDVA